MKKNIFASTIIAGVLIAGGALVPSASALSIDDIQTQIKELLAKVADLTKQLNELRGQGTTPPPPDTSNAMPMKHRICSVLYRNLSQGIQGDDVQSLQEFLNTEGYLSANATGYFGPMTAQAVAKWQASEGVSAVGAFGPMSRERIKAWCGGGGNRGCTKEYNPVCGSKPIVCITTPCNPIQQTYSNRCMMRADGATYLHEGACRDTSTNPADDARCKAWYDGCNTCSRQSPGSPAMCTLRACMLGSDTAAYCTAWFDDSGNKPPTISAFSGPTTLAVNASGTWTIQASDPENGSLNYSITWGDEYRNLQPYASAAARENFVQTTTFTHAYAQAGTYTVIIIVASDTSGAQAKTTSTVHVGSSLSCVSYGASYPEGTKQSCIREVGSTEQGGVCIADAFYVCRSGQWKVEGGLPVACTMDAMQCPNGSWVGRTGSNCQFVCP